MVGVKSPLELASELAETQKEADVKLAKFIIENSDPESYMKSENSGNFAPMHVAAVCTVWICTISNKDDK